MKEMRPYGLAYFYPNQDFRKRPYGRFAPTKYVQNLRHFRRHRR